MEGEVLVTSVTVKPASSMEVSVGRLQSQHTTKPAHPVHAVLVPGQPGIAGADVLDEEQLPAGAQHPADLAQRPRLVADPAQHEGGHDGVKGAVLEREVFGGRPQNLGLGRLLAGAPLEAARPWPSPAR